jgi:hypothetical protein
VAIAPDGAIWAGTEGGITRYGEPFEPVVTPVAEEKPAPFPTLRNYPNPFNPSTTIPFLLPDPGIVTLIVYDITGCKIRTLVSERMSAGTHSVNWDGRDDNGQPVGSGVYLSRLRAGKLTATGRMLLVK